MPGRRRIGTTCLLREFMAANQTKPEEQATAVLAAALRTSEVFREALLEPLKLEEEGAVVVDTEVGTGSGQEAVDIELRITGSDGSLRRRVWIEVKVNSLLADARGPKGPQLVRYRDALNVLDEKRSDLNPSVLAVLLRRADEKHERPQIDATYAAVLHWQDVADIAEACGRACSGMTTSAEWRELAREPEGSLELANLDTLLWFVEEATHRDRHGQRQDIVGVKASSPVTKQQTAAYAAAYPAVVAVALLAGRTATELEDDGRVTASVDTDSEFDESGIFDVLAIRITADPRGRDGWWHALGGTMEFWVMPVDPLSEPPANKAQLWTGINFYQPIPISAEWRGELESAGFQFEEDDDGLLASVGVWEPLGSVIGVEDSLGQQGKRAAHWINDRLTQLARIAP